MIDEQIMELQKYLRKLSKVINECVCFTWMNKKIVDKHRVDDVLCCIEGSLPDSYQNYVKKNHKKQLSSYTTYMQLLQAIKNKPLFSTSHYSVNFNEANILINRLIKEFECDIKRIQNKETDMV